MFFPCMDLVKFVLVVVVVVVVVVVDTTPPHIFPYILSHYRSTSLLVSRSSYSSSYRTNILQ